MGSNVPQPGVIGSRGCLDFIQVRGTESQGFLGDDVEFAADAIEHGGGALPVVVAHGDQIEFFGVQHPARIGIGFGFCQLRLGHCFRERFGVAIGNGNQFNVREPMELIDNLAGMSIEPKNCCPEAAGKADRIRFRSGGGKRGGAQENRAASEHLLYCTGAG